MVVMPGLAEPVRRLAFGQGEPPENACFREMSEGSVDGGQSRSPSPSPQAHVELLSGNRAALPSHGIQDGEALASGPKAGLGELFRAPGHGPTLLGWRSDARRPMTMDRPKHTSAARTTVPPGLSSP